MTASCGQVTTGGFISVKLTQEIDAAAVVKVKNAADKICVYDPGCDSLLDLLATIELCQVNPDIVGLITGQEVVLDYAGNSVGFRRSTDLHCDLRWALEVWTDVPGTACSGTPPRKQFGYFLVPCLRAATLSGDITIDGTNAVTLTLTAKTTIPSLWGTGPATSGGEYKVVPTDSSNTPGYLLSPIGATTHDHAQLTTIAPPAIPNNCGCVPVTITGSSLVPVISSLSPNTALNDAGGQNVELVGAHLTGATAVTVGGTAGTQIVVVDDNHIVFETPAKATGTYTVTVTTPNGTSATFSGLTYA